MRTHDFQSHDESRRMAKARDDCPSPPHLEAVASGQVSPRVPDLQRSSGKRGSAMNTERSLVHEVVGSGRGSPLPAGVREEMGVRLGHDFSNVLVHTNALAQQSAEALGANAYTVGSHIAFQRGRFDASSVGGRRLLAHELVHVMQQGQGAVNGASSPGGMRVSDPSDPLERDAAIMAEQVLSAPSASPQLGPTLVQSADMVHPAFNDETDDGVSPARRSPHRGRGRGEDPPGAEVSRSWCLQRQGPSPGQVSEVRGRVIRELDHMEAVIRTYLIRVPLADDIDVTNLLDRWRQAHERVAGWLTELGGTFPDDTERWRSRLERSYSEAVRNIVVRGALAQGQDARQLMARHETRIASPADTALTDYLRLDPAQRLLPQHSPRYILEELNPGDRLGQYCRLNCPAAAEAVQNYLQTGIIRPAICRPIAEPNGYAISVASWSQSRGWAPTRAAVDASTPTHGAFVVVEGDRGTGGPDGLSQHHYFVIVNIDGQRLVVDGYLHEVHVDLDRYVTRLNTVRYRIANGRFTTQAQWQ